MGDSVLIVVFAIVGFLPIVLIFFGHWSIADEPMYTYEPPREKAGAPLAEPPLEPGWERLRDADDPSAYIDVMSEKTLAEIYSQWPRPRPPSESCAYCGTSSRGDRCGNCGAPKEDSQ